LLTTSIRAPNGKPSDYSKQTCNQSHKAPICAHNDFMLRCQDGVFIDWPYSDVPFTSLMSEHVGRLTDEDHVTRALAHAELADGQLRHLYKDACFPRAKLDRWIGWRIRDYNLAAYCRGIGINRLKHALRGRKPTRQQLIRQLVTEW